MYLTANGVWFCLTVSLLHLSLRLSVYQSVRPSLPLVRLAGWINNKYLSFITHHIPAQYSKSLRGFLQTTLLDRTYEVLFLRFLHFKMQIKYSTQDQVYKGPYTGLFESRTCVIPVVCV